MASMKQLIAQAQRDIELGQRGLTGSNYKPHFRYEVYNAPCQVSTADGTAYNCHERLVTPHCEAFECVLFDLAQSGAAKAIAIDDVAEAAKVAPTKLELNANGQAADNLAIPTAGLAGLLK